jgi:hypothetical protein
VEIRLNNAAFTARMSSLFANGFETVRLTDEFLNEMKAINRLIAEKEKVTREVAAIMDVKALTKKRLTKAQMRQFMTFNAECEKASENISEVFEETDILLKSAFISNEYIEKEKLGADFYGKLSDVLSRKKALGFCLRELVGLGNCTANALRD